MLDDNWDKKIHELDQQREEKRQANRQATGQFLGFIGGIAGIGVYTAVVASVSSESALQDDTTKPYIGCDFSFSGGQAARKEAEERRSFGALDKAAVYEACKKAVDNFFEKGLTGKEGKVVIELPPREAITASKVTAPSNAPTP
jgi:hypothetical protein